MNWWAGIAAVFTVWVLGVSLVAFVRDHPRWYLIEDYAGSSGPDPIDPDSTVVHGFLWRSVAIRAVASQYGYRIVRAKDWDAER